MTKNKDFSLHKQMFTITITVTIDEVSELHYVFNPIPLAERCGSKQLLLKIYSSIKRMHVMQRFSKIFAVLKGMYA